MSDLPTRARDALRTLHEQGRIASPWLPGMLTTDGGRLCCGHITVLVDGVPRTSTDEPLWLTSGPAPVLPDPTDPATQGCLLALIREAANAQVAWAEPDHRELHTTDMAWEVFTTSGAYACDLRGRGPTRAEALVAALEALAVQDG